MSTARATRTLGSQNTGFTLVELISVIVILGVLGATAATAVPKFISLTDAANQSNISALAGAMRSASSLVFAKCVVSASCDQNAGPVAGNGLRNSLVAVGKSITLAFGYPVIPQQLLYGRWILTTWLMVAITIFEALPRGLGWHTYSAIGRGRY